MRYKFLAVFTSVLSVLVLSFSITNHFVNSKAAFINTTNPLTQSQPVYLYYIGDYQGNLAVFKANNKQPIKIYDVYTSSLPPKDYEMVIKKIGVNSETELQHLIDEYTS